MKIFLFILAALAIVISSCSDDNNITTSTNKDIELYYSGCKENVTQISDSNKSIIHYEYKDGDLFIYHINAGFNCCPGEIFVDYKIEGDVITVTEREKEHGCNCLCLYDLDFVIKGLPEGNYDLIFKEELIDDPEDELRSEIDLTNEPEGTFSMIRARYPWSLPDQQGISLNYTGCKNEIQVTDSNKTIINYEYSGGDLHLWHINSAFNCCPGELFVDIAREDNVITIKERELEAGCRCVCLFNLDFYIRNIKPGKYVLRFDEPYAPDEKDLEFEIDIENTPSGSHSEDRNIYPWNT